MTGQGLGSLNTMSRGKFLAVFILSVLSLFYNFPLLAHAHSPGSDVLITHNDEATALNYQQPRESSEEQALKATTLAQCLAPADRYYSQVIHKHDAVFMQTEHGVRSLVASGNFNEGDLLIVEHTTAGPHVQYMIADDVRLMEQLYPRTNEGTEENTGDAVLLIEDLRDIGHKLPLIEQKLLGNMWIPAEGGKIPAKWSPDNLVLSHFISAANHHCDATAAVDFTSYEIQVPHATYRAGPGETQKTTTITVSVQYLIASRDIAKGEEITVRYYAGAGHGVCNPKSRSPLQRFQCQCGLSEMQRHAIAESEDDRLGNYFSMLDSKIAAMVRDHMSSPVGFCTSVRQHIMSHLKELLLPDVLDDMDKSYAALKDATSKEQMRKYFEGFSYYRRGESPARVLSDVQWIHNHFRNKNVIEFIQMDGPAGAELNSLFAELQNRLPVAMKEYTQNAEEELRHYLDLLEELEETKAKLTKSLNLRTRHVHQGNGAASSERSAYAGQNTRSAKSSNKKKKKNRGGKK